MRAVEYFGELVKINLSIFFVLQLGRIVYLVDCIFEDKITLAPVAPPSKTKHTIFIYAFMINV